MTLNTEWASEREEDPFTTFINFSFARPAHTDSWRDPAVVAAYTAKESSTAENDLEVDITGACEDDGLGIVSGQATIRAIETAETPGADKTEVTSLDIDFKIQCPSYELEGTFVLRSAESQGSSFETGLLLFSDPLGDPLDGKYVIETTDLSKQTELAPLVGFLELELDDSDCWVGRFEIRTVESGDIIYESAGDRQCFEREQSGDVAPIFISVFG